MKNISFFFLILLTLLFNGCYYNQSADILIHNAKIYTVDSVFTIAEAMAIKDGKIIDIGANNELKNRYEAVEEIDAKNQSIYPGFIDAHCHFFGYGNTFFQVNLVGTNSWKEVISKCIEFSKDYDGDWIQGRGWDQNDWDIKEFPNKRELDSLFPNKAVLLKRIDGHAAIANSRALDLAKITVNTNIAGGVFEKVNGELSGILIDNAVDSVSSVIPNYSYDEIKKALLKAEKNCFAVGLTTLDDAMLDYDVSIVIDSLHKSEELKIKVYGMLMPTAENKTNYLEKGPYKTDKLNIRAFKYFADGALGSRGAKLLKPYSDDIHNDGLFLSDSLFFQKEAAYLKEKGFQMNTHCIGDRANRMILDIYGQILGGTNDLRWRIEHAQIVSDEDLAKFKAFTIIPSVQPTHATSDMYWLEDRVGSKRKEQAYAYKELLEQNGIIALGTDFPIEDISPIKTFYAAVARKDVNNYPEGGFQKENALSREEALKGMTIWAAISNFEENDKGSLEKGKTADFIMLNQDLLKIKEKDILETKVVATFINGEKVYSLN